MEELKFKKDGIDVNSLYGCFDINGLTKEELNMIKTYTKVKYNKHGDYFLIRDYDIRFFKHDNEKQYFFTINTYPNKPETILKYFKAPISLPKPDSTIT